MTDHPAPLSHRAPAATLLARPWRVGRSTGRAIYVGEDDESAVGWMDTRELAAAVVEAVNTAQRPSPRDVSATSTAAPSSAVRGAGEPHEHVLAPAAVAEMEHWRAHLHPGTNVAPLAWFAALLASHAALTARLAAVEQSAPRSEYPEVDAQLAAVCIPCFEGICDMCIEERGLGGDGQPCRCHHGRYYAKRLAAVEAALARQTAALAAIKVATELMSLGPAAWAWEIADVALTDAEEPTDGR